MGSNSSVTFTYIADDIALDDAVRTMSREPVLAFDLESDNNLHHYGARICLLQFATPDANYLVDVLADLDLKPVKEIMENPDISIIMHDADFDMRSLDGELGWRPKNLFDTLIAARLCGHRSFGIASLIEHYFGVKLQKKFQRADWSRRPLPKGMPEYAAGDVHYLLRLRELLLERLERLGRSEWAEEEFERREGIRFEKDDKPLFARVKKGNSLGGRQLALLAELAELRESVAKKLDLPTFKVISDPVLIRLAERPPKSASDLADDRGVHPYFRKEGARAIVDAIARGKQSKPLTWPRKKRSGERLHRLPELLDALKSWRMNTAEREDIEPDLVMPLVALKKLSAMISTEKVLSEEPVRRWQRNAFSEDLKAFLSTHHRGG